jgi:hypothetical protein
MSVHELNQFMTYVVEGWMLFSAGLISTTFIAFVARRIQEDSEAAQLSLLEAQTSVLNESVTALQSAEAIQSTQSAQSTQLAQSTEESARLEEVAAVSEKLAKEKEKQSNSSSVSVST